MALELDKLGYAGIGLLAKMQDMLQDFVEGREKDETEVAEAAAEPAGAEQDWKEKFEDLAELGEERYEEWLDKGKEEREKVADKIKDRANKVFNELGLVTKEDLEELEAKISKLQRAIKKAASSKNA
jgi:polyhydroxyalkanoate synthesis regulator phasin